MPKMPENLLPFVFYPIILLAFLGCAIVGGYLLVSVIRDYRQASASTTSWPSTAGVIVRADIRTKSWKRRTYEVPYLVYRYAVNEHDYESTRFSFGGDPDGSAQEVVGRYPVGTRLTVYYDPAEPGEAVLERGVKASQLGGFLPAAVLLFFAIIIGSVLGDRMLDVIGDGIVKVVRAFSQSARSPSQELPPPPAPPAASGQTEPPAHQDAAEKKPLQPQPGTRAAVGAAPAGPQKPEVDVFWQAFNQGDWTTATNLIAQGLEVNKPGPTGVTPLLAAVQANRGDLLRALLAKKADPNGKSPDSGDTALIVAVRQRYPAITQLLVEHGADLNLQNRRGQTALMVALERRDLASVRLLLENGADASLKDASGQSAADLVHGFRNDEEVRVLLKRGGG